ncbi:MAG: ABC transporter ATP-binding protein, partial [Deltaproteobacteria bacterium]|nr:ABC transporter ATP-binding protein [Deltaproteobacteria bacterium]
MSLSLEAVTKRVGREIHLDNINLKFETGSRNVLLGHTLAGKTSLLRMMAGLDRPTSGMVRVDGEDVTGIKVRKRNIAMVYQQFVNYPSLTVYENIASPLKLSRKSKKEIDKSVREAAAMLHLDPLLDRLPAELSGGQQQRTAIARALVKKSDLLLLDEPLVNLDLKLREELRVELQEIFKQRKAIVVYTTTEPAEALMLGGNVVIID